MRLTIPEPCTENWEQMSLSSDASHFCASCQKCVVDFSAMSDKEILQRLNSSDGKVCGRFSRAQLNRVLVCQTYKPRNYWSAFFSVALTSVVGLNNSVQEKFNLKPNVEILPESLRVTQKNRVSTTDSDSLIVIRGIVFDSLTKEAITGVSILIKGTNEGTSTNVNGEFELRFPESYFNREITLEFSFVSKNTEERRFKLNKSGKNFELLMVDDTHVLGGPMIITEYSKTTLKGKIKKFFKKILK